ncbi:MAG: hypothetical protein K5849_07520 [Bacteroidales bacterium]|nr:hypothetical protein [Bacteroidales bacterium]
MKNFCIAAALAALLPCLASCGSKEALDSPNTNNPPVVSLRGTGFELSCLDCERGFSRDSNYVFEGIWRDGHFWFGKGQLDTMQLNITPDNGIILKVDSGEDGFEGVNAASSSSCINIVPDTENHRIYHLEWISEGRSTITLWCGEGASRREIHFTATSRTIIPLEGIRIRIDGEESTMAVFKDGDLDDGDGAEMNHTYYHKPKITDLGMERYGLLVRDYNTGFDRNDITRHVVFEIAGPIPMNATPTEKIYTALDEIGIIENGVFGDPGGLSPPADYWNYGLYLENLMLNPDFRWFRPITLTSEDVSNSLVDRYRASDSHILYPADLRERLCWIWPQTNEEIFTIAFYQGEIIREPERLHLFPVVFQKMIAFNNIKNWWYYGK